MISECEHVTGIGGAAPRSRAASLPQRGGCATSCSALAKGVRKGGFAKGFAKGAAMGARNTCTRLYETGAGVT